MAGIDALGCYSRRCQRLILYRSSALLSASSMGLCPTDRNVASRGSSVITGAAFPYSNRRRSMRDSCRLDATEIETDFAV